jgi:hypothetical protein
MNRRQILYGIAALLIGVAFYLVNRSPEDVYFVPDGLSLHDRVPQFFGVIGNNLPSFIHTFAFILITVGLLGCRDTKTAMIVSMSWFAIDGLLELGQHPAYNQALLENIPGWFESVPVLENVKPYFSCGRFEALDLAASALGSVTAFIIYQLTRTKWRKT